MEIYRRSVLLMLGLVFCLMTSHVVSDIQGRSVFYSRPYTPSKCYGNRNDGNYIAGVSDALWNNGGECGRQYLVSCIGGINKAPHPCKSSSIVVKVVDYCEAGCQGIINLSKDAFNVIADTNAGIVRVNIHKL